VVGLCEHSDEPLGSGTMESDSDGISIDEIFIYRKLFSSEVLR
jgi:hypothetical protein